ncbi:MAG: tryptophan-rich sensory protein [Bacilli bacterium]|nr:tryptophan-rich sensory protein [Bacilli bacterium]
MNKIKEIIVSIAIPNIVGVVSAIFSKVKDNFDSFNKPEFTPPGIVFPIVWSILYILMGISSYLIYKENTTYKYDALKIYAIQLIINGLWSIIFFRLQWFFIAFITVILLIVLTIIMIYKFYKINKAAGLLQIPYLIWLIVALVLSYNVYLLN